MKIKKLSPANDRVDSPVSKRLVIPLDQGCRTCDPLAHFMRPLGTPRKIAICYLLILRFYIYIAIFLLCASELPVYWVNGLRYMECKTYIQSPSPTKSYRYYIQCTRNIKSIWDQLDSSLTTIFNPGTRNSITEIFCSPVDELLRHAPGPANFCIRYTSYRLY